MVAGLGDLGGALGAALLVSRGVEGAAGGAGVAGAYGADGGSGAEDELGAASDTPSAL
jgi:hypothetical protein